MCPLVPSTPSRATTVRAGVRTPCLTMIRNADPLASAPSDRRSQRFEVRSVTGACYTLVEETDREGGRAQHRYRTAYAGLPVVANDDGSFTIVDTHTRLVRVDRR
jgi:hypothetical protein